MTQMSFCEKCSKERGITDSSGFRRDEFLLDIATLKRDEDRPSEECRERIQTVPLPENAGGMTRHAAPEGRESGDGQPDD